MNFGISSMKWAMRWAPGALLRVFQPGYWARRDITHYAVNDN